MNLDERLRPLAVIAREWARLVSIDPKPTYAYEERSRLKLLLPLLSLFASGVALSSDVEPLAVNLSDLEWSPPGGGDGFPVGVRTATQGYDPVSEGRTYYALFPAGSHFDLHWHTHDEYVVVIAGTLVIQLGDEEHQLSVGSYVVIPGKLNHSWTVPDGKEDAVILVRRAGPADFHFVEN